MAERSRFKRPPNWALIAAGVGVFVVAAKCGAQAPVATPPTASTSATPEGGPSTPPQTGATCQLSHIDTAVQALHAVLTSDQYGYDPRGLVEGSSIGKPGKGYTSFLGRPGENGQEGNGLEYDVLTTAGQGHKVTVTHNHGSPQTFCVGSFSVYPENSDQNTPAIGGYNASPTAGKVLSLLSHIAAFGSLVPEPPQAQVIAMSEANGAPDVPYLLPMAA